MNTLYDKEHPRMKEIDAFMSEKFGEHVPACGNAKSVGGEIVRACNRIIYRFFNDGDVVGLEYGKETLNSPARYLGNVLSRFNVRLNVTDYANNGFYDLEQDYQVKMYDDMLKMMNTLKEHPELFTEPNSQDMFDFEEPDDRDWYMDEDEGDWDYDDYEDDDDPDEYEW